jgi:hypothetical protein
MYPALAARIRNRWARDTQMSQKERVLNFKPDVLSVISASADKRGATKQIVHIRDAQPQS